MLYDKIKELCKEKGISVSYLERIAGLSNGSISKWNESSPNADSLFSVAGVLEVTMEKLLKE